MDVSIRCHSRTSEAHRLIALRDLSESSYVLRLSREGFTFKPGQHIHLGPAGAIDVREYSLYSGCDDEYLEVLIREVEAGYVSKQLRCVQIGARLRVRGPFGLFTLDGDSVTQEYLFIATGSGVAPFRAFARSYPGLRYRLLHGLRSMNDRFEYESFNPGAVTLCISRESVDGIQSSLSLFSGRVTEYLESHPIKPGIKCYLCGNCDMIYEAYHILKHSGISPVDLYSEVYF